MFETCEFWLHFCGTHAFKGNGVSLKYDILQDILSFRSEMNYALK